MFTESEMEQQSSDAAWQAELDARDAERAKMDAWLDGPGWAAKVVAALIGERGER